MAAEFLEVTAIFSSAALRRGHNIGGRVLAAKKTRQRQSFFGGEAEPTRVFDIRHATFLFVSSFTLVVGSRSTNYKYIECP